MVRRPYCVLLLGFVAIALVPGGATAQSPFDGRWSVLFNTDRGDCERSYRAGVRIYDGYITADASGFNLDGRVSRSGSVRAVISAQGQAASGSGRLSRTQGGGVWRGQGSRGFCAGRWLAQREGWTAEGGRW